MLTFDIWLEDSQGRQFRRSNHYAYERYDVYQVYEWMLTHLKWFGIRAEIKQRVYTY